VDAENELRQALRQLSVADAVLVARAFSYFSHLANVAEDLHFIRRRDAHERADRSPERPGTLAATHARLQERGCRFVDEVVRYEDVYRLCYVRGPEGILVGIAQALR